jgi:hypothetical protein
VDPVPDPLLLRKSGSAGNRTRVLWICSQELWPLDHTGGLILSHSTENSLHFTSLKCHSSSGTSEFHHSTEDYHFKSHAHVFFDYEPTTENSLKKNIILFYKPSIWLAEKRSVLYCCWCHALCVWRHCGTRRSRDPSLLMLDPSVYSCCLGTSEARRDAARHGTAELGSARRKHHFVYCCVIAGTCYEVTVLACSKYATI